MNFRDFFSDDYKPKWDYIETIPEFAAMKGCLHSKHYHGEGDPWEHTKLVVNNAVSILKCPEEFDVWQSYSPWRKEALLLAALFHDIAKPVVTCWNENEEDWCAPNHADTSAKLTRKILVRGGFDDIWQRELIVAIVRCHMRMHQFKGGYEKIQRKLYEFCIFDTIMNFWHATFDDARFINLCDLLGTWNKSETVVDKLLEYKRIKHYEDFAYVKRDTIKKFREKSLAYNQMHSLDKNSEYEYTVYLMIGVSGSGKSTYIKNNLDGLPIVSRDLARVELGLCKEGEKYVGSREQEDRVTSYLDKKMLDYAKNKQSFIIDDMNIKKKHRDRFHILLDATHAEFVYIYVEAPSLSDSISRRKADYGEKAEDLILDMYSKMEFPYPYEYTYKMEFVVSKDIPKEIFIKNSYNV